MITIALICFPLLVALVLFLLGGKKRIRWIAMVGAVAEFIWALFAWLNYLYYCKCSLRFEAFWLDWVGISGKFGMNDVSMAVILGITFLVPLILLFTWRTRLNRSALFPGLLMLAEMLIILVMSGWAG